MKLRGKEKWVQFLFLVALVFAIASCSQDPTTPAAGVNAEIQPRLQRLLEYYDSHFDDQQQLLRVNFIGPGYHTRIASGTSVHPVRESFYYAAALLQRGQAEDVQRAKTILEQLLPLQQSDRDQPGYGVWPWLLEEPLEEMQSIDLNWADFCGSAIAQILVDHREQLNDPSLEKRMQTALRHAAVAIRKRDIGAEYTNVAVLGGGVCAVAGEILQDASLLEYGRKRLQHVVAANDKVDSFAEYNSPPYGKVVIGESERVLQLVQDKETRRSAEAIRTKAWEMFADSFHLPTQQWAGPHSRHVYRRLTTTLVHFLNDRTDLQIEPHPSAPVERPRGYGVVTPLPCPTNLLAKIKSCTQYPKFVTRIFSHDRNGRPFLVGKTWMDSNSNIGSINRASFWTQRQPVNGYWKTETDPAVAFRLRFFKDGRDFASIGVRTVQKQNRVLCVLYSLPGRGDWHRSLDRPESGIFEAKDLRMRLELEGVGVQAVKTETGTFNLQAGNHELIVVPAPGALMGQPVEWQVDNQPNLSAIEAVCYSGEAKEFDFRELIDIQLAFGLQLQEIDAAEQPVAIPELELGQQRIDVSWSGMKVAVPAK